MNEIEQLKAENEQLKEEINKLSKKHEDYCNTMYWQMKEQMDKYRFALQEIKDCLNTLSGIDNDFVNTETYLRILDLITKAESEG